MRDSEILKRFFDEQHAKWKKKGYLFFQGACGGLACRSSYSEWLKQAEKGPKKKTAEVESLAVDFSRKESR